MKTPTITPIPLPATLAAAEEQVREFRARKASLQADLEGLRAQRQVEMQRALGSGGTSPALKDLQRKTAETEELLEQADQLIQDADQLVRGLHEQVKATAREEAAKQRAAEVARRSAEIEETIAELSTANLVSAKVAGKLVIQLGELERVDPKAIAPLIAKARYLDHMAPLLAQGWKVPRFTHSPAFEWWVQPIVPPVPGLEKLADVGIAGYLKIRDAAPQAAPGGQR